MPEIQLQSLHNEKSAPMQEAMPSSEILQSISQRGIEVGDSERITSSLDVLRQDLGIDDAAFTDFKRSIVLVAAAERLARLNEMDSPVGTWQ